MAVRRPADARRSKRRRVILRRRTLLATALALSITVATVATVTAPTVAPAVYATTVDDAPWLDARRPIGQRVEELLSRMTLDEKVQLMYGVGRPRGVHSVGYVPGVPRLGIPSTLYSDGPVGVKDSCFSEIYPDNCQLGESTALPATVSLAASFDHDLARAYGRLVGAEARARGVDVLLGPGVNIVRIPQGGRNFEYFSEDPYLTGRLAASYVQGLQSQDVAAQLKHYALNNQELDRHTTTSNADERTMREIYLPGWRTAVAEGDAYSVMCANNMVNGTYNCEHAQLLNEILKGEWGFGGVVGTDYCATRSALGSANGGLDQSFTGCEGDWGRWYRDLPDLVRQGQVSEAIIEEHVRRILTMFFRLDLFGDRVPARPVDIETNGAFARRAAESGTVLLKNDDDLLPLDAESLNSIAVIGPYADEALTGGGGSSAVIPYYTVSPVQGIRNRVGDGVPVTTADGSDLDEAAALARESDVAVVVVNDSSREGQDRPNIDLPGNQNQLVETVTAANERTVVVLNTGSVVTMPWISDVHSLLQMWYGGQEVGNALASVLFGDVNPSGKLPVTFPVSLEQTCCNTPPRYPHADGVYEYSEGLQVGYRWYDAQGLDPLFPFGFGLSYTTFRYSDLDVTPQVVSPDGEVRVSLRVTNTGGRVGNATPQVYVGFPDEAGEPPRRLAAFDKVRLAPGQSKRVTMTLPPSAFSYWSTSAHNWDFAPGMYTVAVGSSSRDLPLRATVGMQYADGEQGIEVQAPDVIAGGTAARVTVTITNTSGHPLTRPEVTLRVPHGWKATAAAPEPIRISPHGEADFTYRVSAPDDAGPGLYTLTAAAGWTGLAQGSATRAVSIRAE